MNTETIFGIISIGLLTLYVIVNNWIDKIKQKSFSKGYIDGQNEVVRSLKNTAFWFNEPGHRKEFNSLMLYSMIYQKYKSVDSDLFRKKINELGLRKLKDLSREELENLMR